MRARLVTILVLLLALAVPLQGLLASAWPVQDGDTVHTTVIADNAAEPCHGHDWGAAGGDAGCGCCAVCGSAALPAGAPSIARDDLRSCTAVAAPAAALTFVTEGPERPPRG